MKPYFRSLCSKPFEIAQLGGVPVLVKMPGTTARIASGTQDSLVWGLFVFIECCIPLLCHDYSSELLIRILCTQPNATTTSDSLQSSFSSVAAPDYFRTKNDSAYGCFSLASEKDLDSKRRSRF